MFRHAAETCEHSAHGVVRVEYFDVLHGGVVGDEVESPGVGGGVNIAARLEGIVDEEASDGAVCSDSDERGVVDVAVAGGG